MNKVTKVTRYVPISRFEESTAKKTGVVLIWLGIISLIIETLSVRMLGARRFVSLGLLSVFVGFLGLLCYFFRKSFSYYIKLTEDKPKRKVCLLLCTALVPVLLLIAIFLILGCPECVGYLIVSVLGCSIVVFALFFLCIRCNAFERTIVAASGVISSVRSHSDELVPLHEEEEEEPTQFTIDEEYEEIPKEGYSVEQKTECEPSEEQTIEPE